MGAEGDNDAVARADEVVIVGEKDGVVYIGDGFVSDVEYGVMIDFDVRIVLGIEKKIDHDEMVDVDAADADALVQVASNVAIAACVVGAVEDSGGVVTGVTSEGDPVREITAEADA